eukprot:scaffold309279_cov23-Tisochrysis_lutea.AAC.1
MTGLQAQCRAVYPAATAFGTKNAQHMTSLIGASCVSRQCKASYPADRSVMCRLTVQSCLPSSRHFWHKHVGHTTPWACVLIERLQAPVDQARVG